MQSYIHPEFNNAFTKHLSLLIEIDYGHFNYCVYNAATGDVSIIKQVVFNAQPEMQFDFEKFQIAVNNEDTLHCPFHEQHASVAWSPFIAVPAPLFDADNTARYLYFVSSDAIDASTRYEIAEALDMYIVFTLHHKLRYFFEKVQPRIAWHHAVLPFLYAGTSTAENNSTDSVFLDVKEGYYLLVLLRNGQPFFINRFNFSNVDDFMYYLLLACEQKGFDRNELQLYISGALNRESQIYTQIYRFFVNIRFSAPIGNFRLPKTLEIPAHVIFTLTGLQSCASFQVI